MKERDLFSVAVRILGLAFFYHSVVSLPAVFATKFSVSSLLSVAWPLVAAWWAMRGAPFLVNLAFPATPAPPNSDANQFRDAA